MAQATKRARVAPVQSTVDDDLEPSGQANVDSPQETVTPVDDPPDQGEYVPAGSWRVVAAFDGYRAGDPYPTDGRVAALAAHGLIAPG